jgi:hypothetical protein
MNLKKGEGESENQQSAKSMRCSVTWCLFTLLAPKSKLKGPSYQMQGTSNLRLGVSLDSEPGIGGWDKENI